jgi:hypothetical protein|nr:MAG TPA: hypothetical protein [Caudoviricetes sp.]
MPNILKQFISVGNLIFTTVYIEREVNHMKLFKKDHVAKLEETIEAKLDELNMQLAEADVNSKETVDIVDDIDLLTKALSDIKVRKMQGKEKMAPQVKAAIITTIGGAIASIAGIIIIRDYEAEDGLFTSSAKNFIKKLY